MQISPDIIAMIILISILYLLHSDRMVGRRQAKVLSFIALLILFLAIIEVLTVYLQEDPTRKLVSFYKFSNVLGFLVTIIIGIMLATFCLHMVKGSAYDKSEKISLLSQLSIVLFGSFMEVLNPQMMLIELCYAVVLYLYYDFLKELTYKYDSLTSVKSRRCFDSHFEDARESDDLYIIIFDINNLKSINDRFGHAKGDEYIRSVAKVIKKYISQMGVLYRIGGDEFCCLCKGTPLAHLIGNLGRLENEVCQIRLCNENDICTYNMIAYGYARYSRKQERSIEECFDLADKAMYLRKFRQKQMRESQFEN